MAGAPEFLCLFLVLTSLDVLHSYEEEYTLKCSFECGKFGKLGLPFVDTNQPKCEGFLPIDGCNETVQKVQLIIGGDWYKVEEISQHTPQPIITIHDKVLLQSQDCKFFSNLTPPNHPLVSYKIISNITYFSCSSTANITLTEFNRTRCYNRHVYYRVDDATNASYPSMPQLSHCSPFKYQLQNPPSAHDYSFFNPISANLTVEIQWPRLNCSYCREGLCQKFCSKGNNKLGLKLGVGMSSAGIMAGLMIIMIICFTKKLSKEADSKNIMAASLGCNLAVKRYSFKDVKKLTNKFGDKLGEGGFGSVYKGVLPDGRQVAVKVLNEAKDHGESFINEIASISRTSHVNIVSLLGYCHEGHKRALIYEFMVNGSLEKFIHQDKYPLSGIDFLQLRWEMLYQIALGIGRGLEYLHRGCNTRILHFDIKPHNILLDDEFFPKISDFGLAKLCPSKESIISMTGTRGTAGYIAPEVFSRNFGVVSHKSDVYSYGMMVLEMVGGRKNINAEADRTSEIYFPHWIYSRLELDEELGLQSIVNEDDKEISRKMIIVGLWCIQTNPSNRPPMSQVLKMLEGTLKSLEIPPKPYLSSPPRLLPDTDADSSNWERFMPNKHCLRFVFNSSLMLSVGYPMVVS